MFLWDVSVSFIYTVSTEESKLATFHTNCMALKLFYTDGYDTFHFLGYFTEQIYCLRE